MKTINEDEFYETWRKCIEVNNSLPIKERGNFGGFVMLIYKEVLMIRRKRFCDTLERIRKAKCNTH